MYYVKIFLQFIVTIYSSFRTTVIYFLFVISFPFSVLFRVFFSANVNVRDFSFCSLTFKSTTTTLPKHIHKVRSNFYTRTQLLYFLFYHSTQLVLKMWVSENIKCSCVCRGFLITVVLCYAMHNKVGLFAFWG